MGRVESRIAEGIARFRVDGDFDPPACAALIESTRRVSVKEIAASAAGAAASPPRAILDLSGVGRVDSIAIGAICEAYRIAAERGIVLRLAGLSPDVRRLLEVFKVPQTLRAGAPAIFDPYLVSKRPSLEALGAVAIDVYRDVAGLVQLAGETAYWLVAAPVRGEVPRLSPVVRHIGKFGVDAIPIVSLIACLMGVALAINASYQLAPLGAMTLVANLVGVAIARELGPLIAAIVVAGRTGAEIAAEIGTMVVTEEVDALRTMGLNPVRQIVVPKVIGLAIALPALTAIADVVGIGGGYLIGVGVYGISSSGYIDRTIYAVTNGDYLTGLAKSGVFALLIALVGCHRGFNVERGAEGVGRATTSAVVMAIFLIIVADTALTTLFYSMKGR